MVRQWRQLILAKSSTRKKPAVCRWHSSNITIWVSRSAACHFCCWSNGCKQVVHLLKVPKTTPSNGDWERLFWHPSTTSYLSGWFSDMFIKIDRVINIMPSRWQNLTRSSLGWGQKGELSPAPYLLKVRKNRPKLAKILGDLGAEVSPGVEGIKIASSSSPTGFWGHSARRI